MNSEYQTPHPDPHVYIYKMYLHLRVEEVGLDTYVN